MDPIQYGTYYVSSTTEVSPNWPDQIQRTDKQFIYINGIFTPLEDAQNTAQQISIIVGSCIAGFWHDTQAARTPTERDELAGLFRDLINQESNDGAEVIIISHSYGALIADCALGMIKQDRPNEELKYHVITLGGARIVSNERLLSSINYIARHDFVSIGANLSYQDALKTMMGPREDEFLEGLGERLNRTSLFLFNFLKNKLSIRPLEKEAEDSIARAFHQNQKINGVLTATSAFALNKINFEHKCEELSDQQKLELVARNLSLLFSVFINLKCLKRINRSDCSGYNVEVLNSDPTLEEKTNELTALITPEHKIANYIAHKNVKAHLKKIAGIQAGN